VAAHIIPDTDRVPDVLHLHGLHYDSAAPDDRDVNRRIVPHIRSARVVTMPSEWAALPLRRDMRIIPQVIPNGIDVDRWQPGDARPYALWNKNRMDATCNPAMALELARRGIPVVSTYAPAVQRPDTLTVTGKMPHEQMRTYIQNAGVYLATTREVHSIGVLEALAAGVPVLGWNMGGTAETVLHKVTGWLAEEGDIESLIEGYHWLMRNRHLISGECRILAQSYDWGAIMPEYARVYHDALTGKQQDTNRVAVVIPCYNYAHYLAQAIESVLPQLEEGDTCIVVDDGSSDNTSDVAERYPVEFIRQQNQGVSAARNAGVAAVSQPYIICLDADDQLVPGAIDTLRGAIQTRRDIGIVYGSLRTMDAQGNDTTGGWARHWPPQFDWQNHLEHGNHIPCAAMFRREMWRRAGGYHVFGGCEDYEFWSRGLSIGFTALRVTDQPTFCYRQHPEGRSNHLECPPLASRHPWAIDRHYPMGAPAAHGPIVRSYRRPVVSVIVPVGPGHERYVSTAIESLLSQTFRDWECVVVDDTHDGIPRLNLEAYPFAQPVRTSCGAGAGAARNAGLDVASAPLCLFLDADDYLLPVAIEQMIDAYQTADNVSYIYTDWFVWSDGKPERRHCAAYRQNAWLTNGLHSVTVLMDTEHARAVRFNEDMPSWEDWDFFARAAIAGYCGQRLALPLLGYRADTGQRRRYAMQNSTELRNEITARYGPYARGEKTIMGCCGGKKTSPPMVDSTPILGAAAATDGNVRMEYLGQQSGAITYRGAQGRAYRGGNNPHRKYANVHPDDVERLANTGKWRVVEAPAPIARTAEIAPPPETATPEEPSDDEQQTAPKRKRRSRS
jgi:glycosyltransferase involved in cell wall biosynthesis